MVLLFDDVPIKEYYTQLFDLSVDFQENNPKYRCLFGKSHVMNMSKIFLLLEIFFILPLYILFLFPWWILWIWFHVILLHLTLYAIRKRKHRFMWPIVIFSLLQFLAFSFVSFLQLLVAIFDTHAFLRFYSQDHHDDFFTKCAVVTIIKGVVLAINAILFWRLSVFYATKNYFSDRTEGQVSTTEQNKGLEGVAQKLLQPV